MEEKVSLRLPRLFAGRMQEQLGEEYDAFLEALDKPSPVGVRVNGSKIQDPSDQDPGSKESQRSKIQDPSDQDPGSKESQRSRIQDPSEQETKIQDPSEQDPGVIADVPWCRTGFILPERPVFTLDPWFQGGAYYVQEPSSMFLEQAFLAAELPDHPVVLDLCAAPGGKTTHLLSLISELSYGKGERRKDKAERRQEKVDLRRERREFLKSENFPEVKDPGKAAEHRVSSDGQTLREREVGEQVVSKSLSGALDSTGLLVTNEIIRSRAAILKENVDKWGYPDVIVTNGDPADFGSLGEMFDLIVADVPCSGEGLFRKDTGAIGEWSPDNAALCAARQRRIVSEAWKCLKPGGYLIYSTCTFNPEENEVNIHWLRNETQCEPVSIPFRLNGSIEGGMEADDTSDHSGEERNREPINSPFEKYYDIREIAYQGIIGYQLMPHRLQGEGFFLSLVKKAGELQSSHPWKASPRGFNQVKKQVAAELSAYLLPGTPAEFLEKEGEYFALDPKHIPVLALLERHVKVIQPGTPVATGDGNLLNPHPALATSIFCNTRRFPMVNLNLTDAIRYLQRETPLLPPETPKGWILAAYRDVPLGWLKNLGNRCNNYFPKERRIRMTVTSVPLPWHERGTGV